MIIIRPMSPGDVDEILEIEKKSFKMPWSKAAFLAELANPFSYKFVAVEDKRVVGYIVLWDYNVAFHIANIAVHPERRRRGIGSMLLKKALELAKEMGIKSIYLEVRESNVAAQKLYEKFGFYRIGLKRNYYRDGENAVEMKKVVEDDKERLG